MFVINSEKLSTDMLEEEYIKIFRLYRCVQKIFGTCRVNIRDKFVSAPTKPQKFFSVFCLIAAAILLISSNYMLYTYRFSDHLFLYRMCFCLQTSNYITNACNIIHTRFFNGDENAKFIIQLQNLDRLMNIEKNKTINFFMYRMNIITLALLITTFLLLCSISWYKDVVISLSMLNLYLNQISFTIEIIHCANIFIFFCTRTRFLNGILKNHLRKDGPNTKADYGVYPSKKLMRHLAAKTHDYASCDTDIYLKTIFDVFYKFQQVYRFQVMLCCIKSVGILLMTFNILVLVLQSKKVGGIFVFVHIPSYTIVEYALLILLCICCHYFLKEINTTKRLCTKIMAVHYTGGPLRTKAKKMWKMIENTPPKFSVYDMWQLDLTLVLKIFNILTVYILTILQFYVL